MNLMYNNVGFYRDTYFGYLFFVMFILSNTCYEFSLLNDNFVILLGGEYDCFQYSFVTIHSFCFIVINEKVV